MRKKERERVDGREERRNRGKTKRKKGLFGEKIKKFMQEVAGAEDRGGEEKSRQ